MEALHLGEDPIGQEHITKHSTFNIEVHETSSSAAGMETTFDDEGTKETGSTDGRTHEVSTVSNGGS